MLSSITPFGERSRDNSFGHTATAHIAGSALGGILLGLLIGGIGAGLSRLVAITVRSRLIIVLIVALAALFIEATSNERRIPGRTRQVDENWIQTYRGWVYGGGFGAELGFGISTIITTTLVYVLVVCMLVVGTVTASVALGLTFGAVRGTTLLAAYKVDSPESLRAFHQKLDALRARSRSAAVASLALACVIGLGAIIG